MLHNPSFVSSRSSQSAYQHNTTYLHRSIVARDQLARTAISVLYFYTYNPATSGAGYVAGGWFDQILGVYLQAGSGCSGWKAGSGVIFVDFVYFVEMGVSQSLCPPLEKIVVL